MAAVRSRTKRAIPPYRHGRKSAEFLAANEMLRTGVVPKATTSFDLPRAANVIEWATDPRYLDFPQLFGHYGQYQLIRDMCQLRCPVCNPYDPHAEGPGCCWGKSRSELEDEVLFVWTPAGDTCPRCGGTRDEFVQDGLLQDYNTVLACIGMRSGKSATAGIYATYLEHVIACTAGFDRDALTKRLKQAPGTTFDVAFVATTAYQAEATIWDYYTNFRERSPWLKRYVTRVKDLERHQVVVGTKPWRYTEIDREVRNELVGVRFRSLHSNSAGMAGATRIAAFIDELARFDTSESKRGADEVWRVLSASLKTVRQAAIVYELPKMVFGAKIATSSPISIDDKMMTMVTKATAAGADMDHVLAVKLATWEFNPFQPRASFDEEFAEDAVQAERDFGANPPLTETPLIEDTARFSKVIEPELIPSTLFETIFPEDALGRKYIGVQVVDSIISPDVPRAICFDAGASFDSFAGAMGHPGWVEVMPEPGDPDQRPRRILLTIYDWVIRILPTEKPKRTVWFDSVVKIVDTLRTNFRILKVTFDRWQSLSLIQNVRALGVSAEQEGVVAADFIAFKGDAYAGKIKMLPPRGDEIVFLEGGQVRLNRTPVELTPPACGIYELVKLSRSEDLKRVFNPNKGKRRGYDSDDVAQVLVNVHKQIQKAMSDDPAKQGLKDRLRREQMGGEQWGGGGVVQAMKHWNVTHAPPPAQGRLPAGVLPTQQGRRSGGVPGYTPADTWIKDRDGNPMEPSGAHTFNSDGVARVRRW